MSSDLGELRQDCMSWIREAGRMACERMYTAVASRKMDRSPITDADQAVQDFLMDQIARHFPSDAVISEETQAAPDRHAPVARTSRCWIIDPIDGTRNYVRRVPMFSVSVGLLIDGSPVLGFVYNPNNDHMYSAHRNGGAWLNDRPIQVANTDLASTDIFIGLPSGREEKLPPVVHRWIDRMVMRATGSTALNLALVAAGSFDVMFASRCKLWDMAAGAIIVQEAGGCIVTHAGTPYFPADLAAYCGESTPFLAGRADLVQQLLDELRND